MRLIRLAAIVALFAYVAQAQQNDGWEKTIMYKDDIWQYADANCTIYVEINPRQNYLILKWHQEIKEQWSPDSAQYHISRLDTMFTHWSRRSNPQGDVASIYCEFNPGFISIFTAGPVPTDIKDPYYNKMIPSDVLEALKKLSTKTPYPIIKKMLKSPLSYKTITSTNYYTIYK